MAQPSGSEAVGKLSNAEWATALEQLGKKVKKHQGKDPCGAFFIRGECKRGDACTRHHEGVAASFTPRLG